MHIYYLYFKIVRTEKKDQNKLMSFILFIDVFDTVDKRDKANVLGISVLIWREHLKKLIYVQNFRTENIKGNVQHFCWFHVCSPMIFFLPLTIKSRLTSRVF